MPRKSVLAIQVGMDSFVDIGDSKPCVLEDSIALYSGQSNTYPALDHNGTSPTFGFPYI